MFKNYLKIALRTLVKNKVYALINVSGLAVGMASVLLIALFVQDELSYDRYHNKADRIYRFTNSASDGIPTWIGSPAPLAPALKERFPEIEYYVRIDPFGFKRKTLITYADKSFFEERFILADPELFDVFDFELIRGTRETALSDRNSLVITESMANKYFGGEDPIGKLINYDGSLDFTVSGVMADVPENSHFSFDFVASFEYLNEIHGRNIKDSWGMWNYYSYVLLREHTEVPTFEEKSAKFLAELTDDPETSVHLQPITDIHLRSKVLRDPHRRGDMTGIYLYAAIALVILLIGCVNFMNLYTANSEIRAKEVGMRKVLGAQKSQLVMQFLGEAFIISLLALPLAILLVESVLPPFNLLTEKALDIDYSQSSFLFSGLLVLALVVGFVSGSYPAFLLSGFQPAKMLRGKISSGRAGVKFRNVLVVFQFAVTIMIISSSLMINNQMQYVRNKKLGYDRENIINVPIYNREGRANYETFRTELLSDPKIVDAVATSFTPSVERWREGLYFEGRTEANDKMFYRVSGDFNFLETFGMELAAGRSFDRTIPTDLHDAYIINEAAAMEIGWAAEEAVGKTFGNRGGKVIGVVKDFNFQSLKRETGPLAINVFPRMFQYISIKIRPGDLSSTVRFVEKTWRRVNQGLPFEYFFYEQEFDKLYKSDEKLQTLFGYFAGLAIFIACLGLFGLALFTVQQRTREIGIRKVLGASVPTIVRLLLTGLFRLVLVASIFGWPIAYFAMNFWLRDFAYRINISGWTFLLAGAFALLIAILTVSFQTIKAALSNPIDALRYE